MPRKMRKLEVPEAPDRSQLPGAEKPKRPLSRREKAERALAQTAKSFREGHEEIEKDLDYLEPQEYDKRKKAIEVDQRKAGQMAKNSLRLHKIDLKEMDEREAFERKAVEADAQKAGKMSRDYLRLHKIDLQEMDEKEAFDQRQAISNLQKEIADRDNKVRADDFEMGDADSYRAKFAEDLASAERDQNLKLAAVDYKDLSKQRDWLEREIKKRTGHDADSLNLDPSLIKTATRLRDRARYWFSNLTGRPVDQTQELIQRWRKISAEMETLSHQIQAPVADAEMSQRASAKRARTDEDMETKRALDREEAGRRNRKANKEIGSEIVENLESSPEQEVSLEKGALLRITERIEEMEAMIKQLETFEDTELLGRQISIREEIDGLIRALNAEETSGEVNDKVGQLILKEGWNNLEKLSSLYDEKYSALTEQARTAPSGKRVRSKVKRTTERPGDFGTQANDAAQNRVENYVGESPKTELGVDEELALEANTYRAEHATDIKRVMTEFAEAPRLWSEISSRIAELSPEKQAALAKIFGTRDAATAYVLKAADYQIGSKSSESQRQVIDANMILGLLPHINLETSLRPIDNAEPIPLTRMKDDNEPIPLNRTKRTKPAAIPKAKLPRKKATNE